MVQYFILQPHPRPRPSLHTFWPELLKNNRIGLFEFHLLFLPWSLSSRGEINEPWNGHNWAAVGLKQRSRFLANHWKIVTGSILYGFPWTASKHLFIFVNLSIGVGLDYSFMKISQKDVFRVQSHIHYSREVYMHSNSAFWTCSEKPSMNPLLSKPAEWPTSLCASASSSIEWM